MTLTLSTSTPTARVIDGKQIAEQARTEHTERVRRLAAETGIVPHLAAVLVGENPASAVYVRNKQLACEKAGMKSSLYRLSATTTQDELLALVEQLNRDPDVHGILVQLPLPKGLDATLILDTIHPSKDVDGFHPENVGLMSQGRPRFLPCTPAGVMRMLQAAGVQTGGKHAVVIGRSDIVGKPMSVLLAQKGVDATVTLCHSRTPDIAAVTRQADIVVAAVGIPRFVKGDWIKPGAVVIDVGINRVDDKLVGDVDYAEASKVAGAITPVPGGVGPMTIAMLLGNTLRAAESFAAARAATTA
jgi:methylenetetrahydrofolate dehydrogenase (NADP+)/methenyltetrahydrofolate cyclohydrolase